MGSFLKKAAGFFKAVLPFVIEHWQAVIAFSGVIISGVLAGLALIFDAVSRAIKTSIELPLLALIAIAPFLVYAIIILIMRIINIFRKPPYLKFTGMEYKSTKNYSYKLEWHYDEYNKFVPKDIHPVCHNCGCRLTPLNPSYLYCPFCRREHCEPISDIDYGAIRNIIKHKIIKKLF